MKNQPKRTWWTAGLEITVVLAACWVGAAPALASGTCTTAAIEEPFRLPDGSLHEAGNLTLCLEGSYSPVASMHEVRVDGMAIGRFLSRRDFAEGPLADGARPFMMFQRLNGGELTLLGVANPLRDRMQVHYVGYKPAPTSHDRPDFFARADRPGLVIVEATSL